MNVQRQKRPGVAAIVLAAGGSKRMGQAKQLLPIGGQAMVRRVAQAVCAAGLDQVVVVVGAHATAVGAALEGLPLEVVVNPAWSTGMSSSLRVGLDALQPDMGAALLILADQPGMTADLIRLLVDRYRATGAAIVAPFLQGRRGNPVLFCRALFDELRRVEGDQGGRSVIAAHQAGVERVDVSDRAILLDVDTRQDYQNLGDETGPNQ